MAEQTHYQNFGLLLVLMAVLLRVVAARTVLAVAVVVVRTEATHHPHL
jgi:hypothetical protein